MLLTINTQGSKLVITDKSGTQITGHDLRDGSRYVEFGSWVFEQSEGTTKAAKKQGESFGAGFVLVDGGKLCLNTETAEVTVPGHCSNRGNIVANNRFEHGKPVIIMQGDNFEGSGDTTQAYVSTSNNFINGCAYSTWENAPLEVANKLEKMADEVKAGVLSKESSYGSNPGSVEPEPTRSGANTRQSLRKHLLDERSKQCLKEMGEVSHDIMSTSFLDSNPSGFGGFIQPHFDRRSARFLDNFGHPWPQEPPLPLFAHNWGMPVPFWHTLNYLGSNKALQEGSKGSDNPGAGGVKRTLPENAEQTSSKLSKAKMEKDSAAKQSESPSEEHAGGTLQESGGPAAKAADASTVLPQAEKSTGKPSPCPGKSTNDPGSDDDWQMVPNDKLPSAVN